MHAHINIPTLDTNPVNYHMFTYLANDILGGFNNSITSSTLWNGYMAKVCCVC